MSGFASISLSVLEAVMERSGEGLPLLKIHGSYFLDQKTGVLSASLVLPRLPWVPALLFQFQLCYWVLVPLLKPTLA